MWKFTLIDHRTRSYLKLTLNEYVIADLIYHKSTWPKAPVHGWCSLAKETIADMVGLSKRTVLTICTTLKKRGLIEQNADDTRLLRTTEKWYSVAYQDVALQMELETNTGSENITPTVKKLHHDRCNNFTGDGAITSPEPVQYLHPYNNKNINNTNNNNIKRPNPEEVLAFFKYDMNDPEADTTAQRFLNYWEAAEWKLTNTRDVRNWKPLAANWALNNNDKKQREKQKLETFKPKYKPI